MVRLDLLTTKLSELVQRASRARTHVPATVAELSANQDALDLVSFNLMLAVQSCSDIASHIIADEGWPPAATLAEGFVRLRDEGVIDGAVARSMGQAVGLRNIVAHGYAGVDPTLVYDAATRGLADLEAFEKQVAAWVLARVGRTPPAAP